MNVIFIYRWYERFLFIGENYTGQTLIIQNSTPQSTLSTLTRINLDTGIHVNLKEDRVRSKFNDRVNSIQCICDAPGRSSDAPRAPAVKAAVPYSAPRAPVVRTNGLYNSPRIPLVKSSGPYSAPRAPVVKAPDLYIASTLWFAISYGNQLCCYYDREYF